MSVNHNEIGAYLNKVRNVFYFVHFTQTRNLEGILQHGLCGRDFLDEWGLEYFPTDSQRLDSKENSISLSISFPNYKMFYMKRNQMEPDEDWVILGIPVTRIADGNCYYCSHNAASNVVRSQEPTELQGVEAVKKLFAEEYNGVKRADLRIPEFQTTNPQAEVLCFDRIFPTDIRKIYFNHQEALNRCVPLLDKYKKKVCAQVSEGEYSLFGKRKDYSYWQNET